MARTLSFYFDFISHNAYLAWAYLPTLLAGQDVEVDVIPVVFGVMLKHNGQLGPAEIPSKNRWMLRDVLRKAKRYNIPIGPPHSHPFNPLFALRLVTLPEHTTAQRRELIDAIFAATWVDGVEVANPDALVDYLLERGFDDAPIWAKQAVTPENKQRLKQNTEEAIDRGVFGVPSMLFHDTLYWGFDDFDALHLNIVGLDPLEEDDLAPWYAVAPSISRKR